LSGGIFNIENLVLRVSLCMIYDFRLRCKHYLPRGIELLNLKSAFFNLKSLGLPPPPTVLWREKRKESQ
jgi:hypothetical protein